MKILAANKKAFHNYNIIETLEVGINLIGCEVKSVRQGELNLQDAFCRIERGNLMLVGCYIKAYDKGSFSNVNSRRDRRLLAHKREINRLLAKVKEKGYSLIPLKVYLQQSLVKVEIALATGKKLFDKRETLAKKDIDRDQQREIGNFRKKGF